MKTDIYSHSTNELDCLAIREVARMNKILAVLILGMGLTGAILINSIPPLFESSVGHGAKVTTAGSAAAFALFAILALVLRRHLNKVEKSE